MAKRGRVIVVGSTNTDLVVHCAKLPRPGETVLGGGLQTFAGGKGANQAVAAARAGAQVHFIGAFGDDAFGRARRADLEREGVDCSGCVVKKGVPSGVALIAIGGHGKGKAENQILVAPGANARLTAGDVIRGMPKLTSCDVILCSLEVQIDAIKRAFELADNAMAFSLLNPAPFPGDGWPKDWTHCSDCMTPNETEFKQLIGAKVASRAAAKALWDPAKPVWGLKKNWARDYIVTRGSKGVLMYFATDRIMQNLIDRKSTAGIRGDSWCLGILKVQAPTVMAKDTVGAGDCFNGCLATRIAKARSRDMDRWRFQDTEEAIRFAVAAAALKVTRHGAQAGMPYRAEILKMLKRMK